MVLVEVTANNFVAALVCFSLVKLGKSGMTAQKENGSSDLKLLLQLLLYHYITVPCCMCLCT